MWSTMIIMHLPEPQVVTAFLGMGKSERSKQLLVICPMATFNDSILPGRALLTGCMNESQCSHGPLESREPLRMSCVFHRKSHGIVGPDKKKGGRCSRPRRKTWATVSLRVSAWISLYL